MSRERGPPDFHDVVKFPGARTGRRHEAREEVVRRYFDALDTSESVEEGGMGSEREAVEGDLKELTLEELHDKIRETKSLLERFYDVAEDGRNWFATGVLADARNRTLAALERVEEAMEPQA